MKITAHMVRRKLLEPTQRHSRHGFGDQIKTDATRTYFVQYVRQNIGVIKMNRRTEEEMMEIWDQIRMALNDIAYSLSMMRSK
jgi:hypothetical protein